jgi:hypothetical protein
MVDGGLFEGCVAVGDTDGIAHLVEAYNATHTAITLELNPLQRDFLLVDALLGDTEEICEPSKATLGHDSRHYRLRGGQLATFPRIALNEDQFPLAPENWHKLSGAQARGIDFTDELLEIIAISQGDIIPDDLQPTTPRLFRQPNQTYEADKALQRRALLRHRYLHEKFQQNAPAVSILAVIPSPENHLPSLEPPQ